MKSKAAAAVVVVVALFFSSPLLLAARALLARRLPKARAKTHRRLSLRPEALDEGRARRCSSLLDDAEEGEIASGGGSIALLDLNLFRPPLAHSNSSLFPKKTKTLSQSLVAPESFQHIIRVLNTNLQGAVKTPFAMTSVTGIGRRFAILACKKAEVDMRKRAGELSAAELEQLMIIVSNPRTFKVPDWFLNRQRDPKDGTTTQLTSSALSSKMRDDFERLKKIRNHRGLRHYWGLRVKGQHTKTTGRRGKTVGVAKKK